MLSPMVSPVGTQQVQPWRRGRSGTYVVVGPSPAAYHERPRSLISLSRDRRQDSLSRRPLHEVCGIHPFIHLVILVSYFIILCIELFIYLFIYVFSGVLLLSSVLTMREAELQSDRY